MAVADAANELQRRYGLSDEPNAGKTQRVVWFGRHRISVADIISADVRRMHDRPISGLIIAATAFVAIATLFAFLVFDNGWRDRYLIATAMLVVLGAAGFLEVCKAKPQSFFDVRIKTRSAEQVAFASADECETRDFIDMLRREGVSVRRAG